MAKKKKAGISRFGVPYSDVRIQDWIQPKDTKWWQERDPQTDFAQASKIGGRPRNFPDLQTFVKRYMRPTLPLNWHHELFMDILQNKVIQEPDEDGNLKLYMNIYKPSRTQGLRYIMPKENRRIMIMAPRHHAKSQIFSIWYPLWEIYRNPNIRILIVSINDFIASSFSRTILQHLESNQDLIEGLGDLMPEKTRKWGEKALIVARKTTEKDPTIAAIGAGGGVISRRADLIIMDDLLDMTNARTKQQREKIKMWFENVLLPVLDPNGRLIVVGTAWYQNDLYDELMRSPGFDIKLKLKAMIYLDKHQQRDKQTYASRSTLTLPYTPTQWPLALKADSIFDESVILHYHLKTRLQSGVLWEDMHPYKELKHKYENEMSHSAFMRQYLNEPVSEQDQVFKKQHIDEAVRKGKKLTFAPGWSNLDKPEGFAHFGNMVVAIGVDLAISKKNTADNSAITVWGLTEKRERVLLWAGFGKWSTDEIKQRVIESYHSYNPIKVKVESIAYQDMLRQELSEDIPVEGFKTTSSKKFNEETGIAYMAMLFEQGRVIIPSSRDNLDNLRVTQQLLSELAVYTYDSHAGDLLMASWFAFEALREFDNKLANNRGFFSTPAIVEQLKWAKSAHRILLLGTNPRYWRFAAQSLVTVFREIISKQDFVGSSEKFLIFYTRESKNVAYIFEKHTSEVVGVIRGHLSVTMMATLLERAGKFFNNAQVIVARNGEGEAVYRELEQKMYPNLTCMQPGKDGLEELKPGFIIDETNLPRAVDYLKQKTDSMDIQLKDRTLIKEMSELIAVTGDKLELAYGGGQSIKTLAVGLWLLDKYDNSEKKLYNGQSGKKRRLHSKKLDVPYLVFQ